MVVDALLRRHSLFVILDTKVLRFQLMKEYYDDDKKMNKIMMEYFKGVHGDYTIYKGFLFKGNQLYVLKWLFREVLIRKTHGDGLTGYFGVHKTLEMLEEHVYWSKMLEDV